MRIFIISDTHFGHKSLIEKYKSRPPDFEEKIKRNWNETVRDDDLVIHLGDVVVGKSIDWNTTIPGFPGRKILVPGNHDIKSESWYMSNGFDFCCHQFLMNIFGLRILFSHEPLFEGEFDLNIHGHLHLGRHREIKSDHRHYLVALEDTGYQLRLLETVVKEWKKSFDKI
jgi:calcineurin-like phosphoesterase family protein